MDDKEKSTENEEMLNKGLESETPKLSEEEQQEQNRIENRRNFGFACLSLAILLILFLPVIIYPSDAGNYYFEATLNAVRYSILAMFSFVIGILCLFGKKW